MRFHTSVLSALTASNAFQNVSADACGDICAAVEGLCLDKGSWCDESSQNCKNLFMTPDYDICFLTPSNACKDLRAVKCEKAAEELASKQMFDRAKKHIETIPQDKRPRYELKIDMPPPTEMAGFCVIC